MDEHTSSSRPETREKKIAAKKQASESISVEQQLERTRRYMKIAVGVIIAVIVASLVFGTYWWVYLSNSDSTVRSRIVSALNLPIGRVDWDLLSYETFQKRVDATEHFFQKQEELQLGLAQNPGTEVIKQQEFERLVHENILYDIADERGVSVSQEDIDTYFNENIVPQAAGGIEEVTQTLNDLYGWSIDEFKTQILAETVLRQKLQEDLGSDESLNTDAKQRIQEVYDQVKSGAQSFEDLATEYSDDTVSAEEGGALGSISRGQTVESFEEKAYATPVGEISEPFQSEFGWHILKVNSKDESADTVDVSHILIMSVTVDELIEERKAESTIRSFVPSLYDAETTFEVTE